MDCCAVEVRDDPVSVLAGREEPSVCMKCKGEGKPVSRKTVLSMIKPEFIEEALNGNYRFCSAHECPIVYFEEQGIRKFTVDDLRVTVGLKATSGPIAVCYCFGFDESHLREEISQTGATSIPDKIAHLIREGLCACDVRNPSGSCCLGEVNKTVKRLKDEFVQVKES